MAKLSLIHAVAVSALIASAGCSSGGTRFAVGSGLGASGGGSAGSGASAPSDSGSSGGSSSQARQSGPSGTVTRTGAKADDVTGGALASAGNASGLLNDTGLGEAGDNAIDPLARVSVDGDTVVGSTAPNTRQALGVNVGGGTGQGQIATVNALQDGQIVTASLSDGIVGDASGAADALGVSANNDRVLGSGDSAVQVGVLSNGQVVSASLADNGALNGVTDATNGLVGVAANNEQVIGGENDAIGANILNDQGAEGSVATVDALSGGDTANVNVSGAIGGQTPAAGVVGTVTGALNGALGN